MDLCHLNSMKVITVNYVVDYVPFSCNDCFHNCSQLSQLILKILILNFRNNLQASLMGLMSFTL